MPDPPDPRGRGHVQRADRAQGRREGGPLSLLAARADAATLQTRLLPIDAVASIEAPGAKPSAVLVPLVPRGDDLHVVLTKRRDDMRKHAGEVSFPGGRADAVDPDLIATALREAHEEIGLDPAHVELIGGLQPVGTFVTNYSIHPYVGLVPDGLEWVPQEAEVAHVVEPSLRELAAAHDRRPLLRRGFAIRTDVYDLGPETLVWGATARMVADLLERAVPLLR